MRVIFTGDPNELEGMALGRGLSRTSTSVYGVTFPMGAEVDVSHLSGKQQQKLLNNPHFRAAGVDAPAAPLILPVGLSAVAPQAEADEAEVDEAAEAADLAALQDRLANKPPRTKKRAQG